MRISRMSFEPTLFFRELSLSESWFSYMAPTLVQAVRLECNGVRSDGFLIYITVSEKPAFKQVFLCFIQRVF